MTFHPIFGNLRKKCALDCDTITYLNEIKSRFLDSPIMKNRLSLAVKRCHMHSSPVAYQSLFSILNMFNVLVCSSSFLDYVHKWILKHQDRPNSM